MLESLPMRNKIINWIKNQVRQAHAKGIVLGLSGGLDSSVVAALAKEAVGKSKVLALIIPCESIAQDLKDTHLVAKRLGITARSIDLSNIYRGLMRVLPKAGKLAAANLKPRLRMLLLYYFANKLNYLVCGTGNKSEIMTGYFTKHGDGAADIFPIGDLTKTEVRILARELRIPIQIITKPPTAGLWPGQTDEGEMGITYPELDQILERLEKKKKQISAKAKVNRVKAMIKRSEHKRQGPKICYI
jgi:NAD+ synthase